MKPLENLPVPANEIEVVCDPKRARLINRSTRPGARELEYILGRHRGRIYIRLTCILCDWTPPGEEDAPSAPPVGTWIRRWIPLDVFLDALAAWHQRADALPATFLLPTAKTKDFHPSPGPLRVNSSLRGHVVAVLRGEGVLQEQPGPSTLAGRHGVRAHAGYRSVRGPMSVRDFFGRLRDAEAVGVEPFDPERDVYKALRPALERLN